MMVGDVLKYVARDFTSYIRCSPIPTHHLLPFTFRACAPYTPGQDMKTLKEKMPRESTIEAHLVKRVKELGGKSSKFVSPGENDQPDRICVLPSGTGLHRNPAFLVECKRPKGKPPTESQLAKAAEWRMFGVNVYHAATKSDVDYILEIEVSA